MAMSIHNEGIYVAGGGKIEAGAMAAGPHAVASNTVDNDPGPVHEMLQLIEALLSQLRDQAADVPDRPELVHAAEEAAEELQAPAPRKPRLIELCSTLMGGVAAVDSLVDVVAKLQHLVLTVL
jgi:hypothetical protein